MIFWSVLFAFLGLAFEAEATGIFAHELNSVLAVLLLVLSAALGFMKGGSAGSGERKSGWITFVAVLTAAFGLLLLPVLESGSFFAASLWFAGLAMVPALGGSYAGAFFSLGIGSALFGVYKWCIGSSLVGWYFVRGISKRISEAASSISGYELSLGPTFNGLGMLILALGIVIGCFLASRGSKHRIPKFVAALFFLGVFYGVYFLIFAYIPHGLPGSGSQAAEKLSEWKKELAELSSLLYPVHVPMLLPLLLSLPVGWYLGAAQPAAAEPVTAEPAGSEPRILIWRPLTITGLAFLSVWCLTDLPAKAKENSRSVAFYEEGFLNWQKPTSRRYGRYSAGMFGNLPLLIQKMGWEAEIVSEITKKTLEKKDILVVINQEEELPSGSVDAIEEFLAEGNSLLVLGDHTFWKEKEELLLNQPIRKSNIRFRFDTAEFFVGGWLHSYNFRPHAVTSDLEDHTNEPGCVVGASLDIKYPAAPLIIGRYGYSDPGDPDNPPSYLDNMEYDPGERLGDLVLAAVENVGPGRVFAVGDTSGFTNSIQVRTWPFVNRVFFWLGTGSRASVPAVWERLGIVFAVLLSLFFLLWVPKDAVLLPVLSGVMIVCTSVSHNTLETAGDPPPLKGNVAVVDLSHGGWFSLEGWHKDAIDGVYLNLMREGYFPIACKDFDEEQIKAADIFVSIVPTHSYSSSELRVLREYMESGGRVLLVTGWEDRAGSEELLETAGLRVAGVPLGKVEGAGAPLAQQPTFYEAWPVEGGETMATARGEPVVVRKKFGKGEMVVIGDSEFLRNKQIEVEEGGILHNIRFFSWVIREMCR